MSNNITPFISTVGTVNISGNTVPSSIWTTTSTSTMVPYYTIGASSTGINVNGTMSADDYIMSGQSIKNILEKINERLAILVPDPKKLAKFAALKEAYEHYKLLEKLCSEPDK